MLTFDEKEHRYFIDGAEVPSVTHITRFLEVDTVRAFADRGGGKWQRERAADRGTRIHAYCADIDYGAPPDFVDCDCARYVQAYLAFLRDYRIRSWQYVEHAIGSAVLGVAGTLDRLGMVDGCLTIADLKSGAKINKAALTAQVSGYRMLLEELGETADIKLIGVQLQSSGKYRIIPCEYRPDIFRACLMLNTEMEAIA